MEKIMIIDLTAFSKDDLKKIFELFIAERKIFHEKFHSLIKGKNIGELSTDELKKYIELATEESAV
ncbi:MAG: hypothetical protein WA063_01195 [Minisyncoccia bacterium]